MTRVDPGTFEDVYALSSDPWAFNTSHYELAKYEATLGALTRNRYERAFEPGCSIGVLTERLVSRVDEIVAVDASPSATAAARDRLSAHPEVEIVTAAIPDWLPNGTFDLLVLSEVGYYWDRDGLAALLDQLESMLRPRADVIAVHWLGHSDDHLLGGAEVHAILGHRWGQPESTRVGGTALDRHGAGFVLERWEISP